MKSMIELCKLKRQEVIDYISDSSEVFYHHGVWNPYKLTDTKTVIAAVGRSGYGADLSLDEESGIYYVSVPADCDMW